MGYVEDGNVSKIIGFDWDTLRKRYLVRRKGSGRQNNQLHFEFVV